MEYIQVTRENIEKEHICCAISNNKDVQVSSKKEWMNKCFDDGLTFIKSVERGKCFIEYIPAENAWVPIIAPGYMYIDTGTTWGWPTNVPYIITSGYEWRWGSFHEGIDISGTGYGSPIYAVQDGVVYDAGLGGTVGIVAGWNVVIQHDNNNYSVYRYSYRFCEKDTSDYNYSFICGSGMNLLPLKY